MYKLDKEISMPELFKKTIEVEMMRCPNCSYEWQPLVQSPKQCPRCRIPLDRNYTTVGTRGRPRGRP